VQRYVDSERSGAYTLRLLPRIKMRNAGVTRCNWSSVSKDAERIPASL
jgi:hypothetical protein